MNRINKLFQEQKEKILSIYFTAGHPKPETALSVIQELEKNGVQLIEIGFPFSDPLADGPTIQNSSQYALDNGMTLKKLLAEIKDVRQTVSIPLILMGYFNTVLSYGVEAFCKDISAIGIDGVILPDLPLEVYEENYQSTFEKYGVIPVFLITPSSPDARIKQTASLSKGFIYMVSSASTTGAKSGYGQENIDYFKRIKDMNLGVPVMTGFGISNKETFETATQFSEGGIIGSAFVKALENNNNIKESVRDFISTLK
jgi:tryptophan synthase alpha chain